MKLGSHGVWQVLIYKFVVHVLNARFENILLDVQFDLFGGAFDEVARKTGLQMFADFYHVFVNKEHVAIGAYQSNDLGSRCELVYGLLIILL